MAGAAPLQTGSEDSPRVKRYHRAHRIVSVTDYAANLALLLALLFAGWSAGLRTFAEEQSSHPALALLIYLVLIGLILEAPRLTLGYFQIHWIVHRYELLNLTRARWLKDRLKGIAVAGGLAALGLEFIYWTLRRWPGEWWVISSVALICLFVLLANLAPILVFPIFFKVKPLEDSPVTERLLDLSRRTGKRVRGVSALKLSEKSKKSKKANAALVGLGNTRRIILSDTPIEKFNPDEVEAVLAHEFGHHVRRHIPRAMMVQALATFPGSYLVNAALLGWGPDLGFRSLADFANLPLLALVSMAVSLVLLPVVNAHSRRMEREADACALGSIQDRSPFISSMEKLAEQNLAERRPAPWIEFIFHGHPSIEKRFELARHWVS